MKMAKIAFFLLGIPALVYGGVMYLIPSDSVIVKLIAFGAMLAAAAAMGEYCKKWD